MRTKKIVLSAAEARHSLYLAMARNAEELIAQGERLQELRKTTGKSQELVAHELEVSTGSLRNWETGKADPYGRNLQKLAAYYGVSERWIDRGTEAPETPDVVAALEAPDDRVAALEGQVRRLADEIQQMRLEMATRGLEVLSQLEAIEKRLDPLPQARQQRQAPA